MNVFNLNTTEIAAKVVALELVRVCVWVFSLFTSRECFFGLFTLLSVAFGLLGNCDAAKNFITIGNNFE